MKAKSMSVFVTVLLSFVGLSACESADWSDPAYINQQLKEGGIGGRATAIKKAKELPDKKRKEVAKGLAAVYMDGDANQDDAMQMLVQYPSVEAKEAYLKEIKEDNSGYVGSAATALGKAGVEDAIPEMLKVFKESDDDDTKVGILRGFAYMPSKKMVEPLLKTLKLDVDNYRIAMHSYSCEILGDVLQDNPDLIDKRGRRTLVRAMYLGNKAGQTVTKECGLAVQQLGTSAIPLLIETFKGENESVNKLLRTYNTRPDYKFPQNHAKVVAAQRLGAMRANEAVELFVEDLDAEKAAPEQLTGQHAVSWRKKEGAATSSVIRGLGDIGDSKARDILEDVLQGEMTRDEWADITDGLVTLQLRQDAAMALVGLGDRDALDALYEMAADGVIIDLERRAKMLEKRWNNMSEKERKNNPNMEPMPIEQRYQFNWMSAEAYTYLATLEDLDRMKQLKEGTEEKPLKKKYKTYVEAIQKAGKCLEKEKARKQGDCLVKLLDHEKEVVREKAAWELGRLDEDVASKLLVENLGTNQLRVREVLTGGIYSAPSAKAIDKIDDILEAESEEDSSKYEQDHYRLKLLRAWLKNNVKDA